MKALLYVSVVFANLLLAVPAFAECTEADYLMNYCSRPAPSLAPAKVPAELMKVPQSDDQNWFSKSVDFMTSLNPFSSSGRTNIKTNVTDAEKSPAQRSAKEIPVGSSAGTASEITNKFTPEQAKILAIHANNINEFYKSENNAYAALTEAHNKTKPIIDNLSALDREIAPVAREADNCRKNPTSSSNCDEWVRTGGDGTTKKLEDLRDRRRALEGSLRDAETNVDNQYRKYQASKIQVDNLMQTVENDKMAHQSQIRDLEMAVRKADVKNAFQDEKYSLMTVDHKIDILEKEIDKQDMGIYLQHKMGRLLASQALCDSTKKCVNGGDHTVNPEHLKELFPDLTDTSDSRTRSKQYKRSAQ